MPQPSLMKRAIAELIGTWVLVFLGTGSVVTMVVFFKSLDAVNQAALLLIGISFGVAVLVMIYVFGHISGTHINPAVSIALWITGRFPAKDMVTYVIAQLIGGFLASATIYAPLGVARCRRGTRHHPAGSRGELHPGDLRRDSPDVLAGARHLGLGGRQPGARGLRRAHHRSRGRRRHLGRWPAHRGVDEPGAFLRAVPWRECVRRLGRRLGQVPDLHHRADRRSWLWRASCTTTSRGSRTRRRSKLSARRFPRPDWAAPDATRTWAGARSEVVNAPAHAYILARTSLSAVGR